VLATDHQLACCAHLEAFWTCSTSRSLLVQGVAISLHRHLAHEKHDPIFGRVKKSSARILGPIILSDALVDGLLFCFDVSRRHRAPRFIIMGDSWEDQADEMEHDNKSSSFSFNPNASSFSFNVSATSFSPEGELPAHKTEPNASQALKQDIPPSKGE
jgi:hypothetical protein